MNTGVPMERFRLEFVLRKQTSGQRDLHETLRSAVSCSEKLEKNPQVLGLGDR